MTARDGYQADAANSVIAAGAMVHVFAGFHAQMGFDDAPQDVTVPTAAAVTPLGAIGPGAELVIDVADDTSLSYFAVYATLADRPRKEVIFRRGAFEPGYALGSFVEDITVISGVRKRLHIRRDDGWPPGSIAIDVDPVDGRGNVGA